MPIKPRMEAVIYRRNLPVEKRARYDQLVEALARLAQLLQGKPEGEQKLRDLDNIRVECKRIM